MGKSIKSKNDTYIDGTGIMHTQGSERFITSTNVLYSNSTGSTTSVALTENATNYQFLLIELTPKQYLDALGTNYQLIIPSNKTYSTSFCTYSSNNQLYGMSFKYTIQNNKITIDWNQAGTVGANNAYWGNSNVYAITKVIGINKKIDV